MSAAKRQQMTDDQRRLAEDNLRLVGLTIHKYFSNAIRSCTIELADARAGGYFALCKAALTFDADKETTFSSYACKCIYNEILVLIRTQKRHPTVSLDTPLSLDDETSTFMDLIESPDPLPEDIYAQLTPDDIIDICMRANVHPGDINAMELRLQGYNHTEVGRILGMSQPGATRRIQRAARCIKERLFT